METVVQGTSVCKWIIISAGDKPQIMQGGEMDTTEGGRWLD